MPEKRKGSGRNLKEAAKTLFVSALLGIMIASSLTFLFHSSGDTMESMIFGGIITLITGSYIVIGIKETTSQFRKN